MISNLHRILAGNRRFDLLQFIVVIRTRDPEVLKRALRKVDGSVREVGQRLSSGAIAVFMRPTIGVRNLEAVLLLLRDAFVTAG